MAELITNRLTFRTNANTILPLLRSAAPGRACPPLFSLNSIRPLPAELIMPQARWLRVLLLLNIELPPMEEGIRQAALNGMLDHPPCKAEEGAIRQNIASVGADLRRAVDTAATRAAQQAARDEFKLFEQASQNYAQYKFFSQYDWCMAHWGTIADIHSVVEDTFQLPTGRIEFTTLWTPPLAALQDLADMFPSVRFELFYRGPTTPDWVLHEIFPVKPWGY